MSSDPASFLKTNGASYLRVGSISIAAYDFVITLPAEFRFYRGQKAWRLSPGCILFILIRYLSIVTIVVSNTGFFAKFTPEECQHYYLTAPILKVLQTMVSQIILGIRAYNISKRSSWVMWTYLFLFLSITSMEWFTNLWDRTPVQNASHNCTPGNSLGHLSVWLYYVLAMVYDVITLCISTYFLVSWQTAFGQMSGLFKIMFYDGLGYFVALTGANIFNLILYRAADESYQSSGASVGYAITWIMSQRILIHLRDAAAEHSVRQVVSRHAVQQPRDISRAMRSPFDLASQQLSQSKDRLTDEYNLTSHRKTAEMQATLDVQVQIEQTVTVDYDTRIEDTYKKSKSGRDLV